MKIRIYGLNFTDFELESYASGVSTHGDEHSGKLIVKVIKDVHLGMCGSLNVLVELLDDDPRLAKNQPSTVVAADEDIPPAEFEPLLDAMGEVALEPKLYQSSKSSSF